MDENFQLKQLATKLDNPIQSFDEYCKKEESGNLNPTTTDLKLLRTCGLNECYLRSVARHKHE